MVFWNAVLEQIERGIDRLRHIQATAAVGMMPVDQSPTGFPKLFRRHPGDIGPEPPEKQDRVDDADLRENFCRTHVLLRRSLRCQA